MAHKSDLSSSSARDPRPNSLLRSAPLTPPPRCAVDLPNPQDPPSSALLLEAARDHAEQRISRARATTQESPAEISAGLPPRERTPRSRPPPLNACDPPAPSHATPPPPSLSSAACNPNPQTPSLLHRAEPLRRRALAAPLHHEPPQAPQSTRRRPRAPPDPFVSTLGPCFAGIAT